MKMSLQECYLEAKQAYHDLLTGKAVVEVVDQNGERIRYSQINANKLLSYIDELETKLGLKKASNGPMRFFS